MAIPLGDYNPTRRRGVVTLVLIAINVGVFIFWQPWIGEFCEQSAFYAQWGAIPNEIIEREPLTQEELDTTVDPRCGVDAMPGKSVVLSVLVAMFLHGGWMHLLGNMLYLLVFGDNVEDRLGHGQYLLFYLVCGAVATVVFAAANPASTTTLVGASGAIAGVLGAYLIMYPTAMVRVYIPPFFFLPLPAVLVLGGWFLLQVFADNLAGQAGAGVAYLAHVAGFLAGMILALILGHRPQRPRLYDRRARRYG
ncbi:MAG TPA: rhomboid family intramembrane serine protease [Euzebyales bacterium]|nr:rhomboid family intramembrane serine protease [Euzebyales bacterium]